MKKAHPLEGPIEKGDSSEDRQKKHPFLHVHQRGKQDSWMSVAIRHWLGALVQDTTCVMAPAPHPQGRGASPSKACSCLPSPLQKGNGGAEHETFPHMNSLGSRIRPMWFECSIHTMGVLAGGVLGPRE